MMCSQAKDLFSPYLDGAVTGLQMRQLSEHVSLCADCQREYLLLRRTQQLLANTGRRKAPADLALRLRVAISKEAAQSRRPVWQGAMLRFENALNAFMVPVTVGLTAAIVTFALLMGFLTLPLQAANDDVPLMLNTAPQLQ